MIAGIRAPCQITSAITRSEEFGNHRPRDSRGLGVHRIVIWRSSAGFRPAIAIGLSRRLYVGDRGGSKYFERNLFRPCASPRDCVQIVQLTPPIGR